MLKETVVALDGSGLAERAPTNGTALSNVTGRQMTVVCAGEPEQTVTAARARSRRVLVVDDEIAIR